MRIHFRKALALMISLLMLCTLLPLSAITSVSAADANLSYNWNDGTLGFNSGSVVSGGPDGSNCYKWTASGGWSATYTTVSNMDPAKDYVITMKAKASVAGNMGITIQNGDWGSYWNGPTFAVTTTWQDVTIEIAANQYPFTKGTILFKFQDVGVAMDLYIDDLVIAEKVTEPDPEPEVPSTSENLVINGDFENGTTGWSTSSAASVVSGGVSGSAIQLNNPSAWSEAARQDIAVEANTMYTLTWYAKRVSGSGVFNFEIAKAPYDGTKPTVTAVTNQTWMNETSGNWVEYKVKIKTTDANGNGISGIMLKLTTEATNPGVLLIDNIVLTKDPVASFDGYLTNGDFEVGNTTGWEVWQGATVSGDAARSGNYGIHLTGNGSWGGILSQGTVNMVAGKTYIVSYYIKVVQNGLNLQIKDGTTSSGSTLISKQHPASDYSNWTLVTHTVTPTQNGIYLNFCGIGGTSSADSTKAESAYLDDIRITEEKEAASDGYITNGDFETGKTTPWTVYSSTAVSTAAKYEGSYGLSLGGDGGWGGLAYQQIKNLKAGQSYTVTMRMKVVAGGVNVQVKGNDLNGDSIASAYRSTTNTGSWTEITLTFEASATYGYLNFCGDGTGTAATVYVDNITVARVGGEVYPEELIGFGGNSYTDDDPTVGNGLAFKFQISATGGTKSGRNEYIESSASIKLDDTSYKLVRMGAVLTNKAAKGTSAALTLDAVNGNEVIEIKGIYLAELTADKIAFAVRVTNIPDAYVGTEIYARAYYIYDDNGTDVTVYGDIKSENYAKASNPKASIKILSIGHSFSKDVMETYLWDMFKAGGYDEVIIGYLYMGGCSMPKHLHNINNNLAQYEYGKNSSGNWVKRYNVTALEALQDEEWDYVNIQSSPDYIGGQAISSFKEGVNSDGTQITLNPAMTEYECIIPITDWIQANALNKAVKTDYHMIWSFSEGCNLWSYTYHNYNQMTMYNNIINMTKTKVMPLDAINNIIPCATSIQNARSSFMEDNFNMPDATQGGNDGYHLNDNGDYVAALTWYCHYSGDDATTMAEHGNLSDAEFAAVAEAVNNAIRTPYAVTESTHKTEG